MKINSSESYFFVLARTYRARIQLGFTNTRGIQYSPYINLCVSPYRVLNLFSGRNASIPMNIKICILNVPKHGNKHDLIHFVTRFIIVFLLNSDFWLSIDSGDCVGKINAH